MSHYRSCMDIVKSIDTSVYAVLDEFDRAYFAVTLKVEFKTGKLLVCIGSGDTLLEAKDKAYAKLGLSIIEEVNIGINYLLKLDFVSLNTQNLKH
uniref:Non-structural protein 3a n=1 Tax=Canine coronavirus TaxID=11153 RepID=A1DS41_9ALPC|nr:non-structural protein 3a [Canine coronavirus]